MKTQKQIDFAQKVKSAEYDPQMARYYGRKRVINKKVEESQRKAKHKNKQYDY